MRKILLCNVSLFFLLSNVALAKTKHDSNAAPKKSSGWLSKLHFPSISLKSPFTKQITETVSYQKEVNPNIAINLSGIQGDITVKAWKNNSVLVEAVKKGSQEAVSQTKIAIHKDHTNLNIQTISADEKKACTTHYTLLVPESAKLESISTQKGEIKIHNLQNKIVAHTHSGRIELNNVAGSIETSTKKGEIVINTNTIIPDTRIFAFSEQGKINLSIPKKTDAVVNAETKKGKIESTVAITTSPQTIKYNRKTLAQLQSKADGTIGKGGSASIKLHTNKGNIILHEV